MGVPRSARNSLSATKDSLKLPSALELSKLDPSPPLAPDPNQQKLLKPLDPNMSNPRLLVNRACIYERRLPGDAYITAHVARLQHGFYASGAVSDKDADHVDFLAISFVFHTVNSLQHRFKSATIKASIRGCDETPSCPQDPHRVPSTNPRFLMHAPHLIYGHVSPETMEWTFSLAGSLGVSEMPVSASVIPSGSTTGRYRRYEMMRIQGSVRTLKSPRGSRYDVEAGEVVWSLEENSLQRSGLPREFTFVMLVQKPTADSQLTLSLEVEPVIQALVGSYPSWLLSSGPYRPLPRRGVNFNREIGQRFEPSDPERGFNFAALESSFDEYIAMPGRKYTRQIDYPVETPLDPSANNNQSMNLNQLYPLLGALNPLQQLHYNGMVLQNFMLQSQLNQLWAAQTQLQPIMQSAAAHDVRKHLDSHALSLLAERRPSPAPVTGRVITESATSEMSTRGAVVIDSGTVSRFKSYENIRASMLRTVHPRNRSDTFMTSTTEKRAQRSVRSVRSEKSRTSKQPICFKNFSLPARLWPRRGEQHHSQG